MAITLLGFSSNNTTGNSITVPLPYHWAGNVAVLFHAVNQANVTPSISGATGWISGAANTVDHDVASSDNSMGFFYKVLTETETDPTINFSQGNLPINASLLLFNNVDLTNVIDGDIEWEGRENAYNANHPDITTTTPNCALVLMRYFGGAEPTTIQAPSTPAGIVLNNDATKYMNTAYLLDAGVAEYKTITTWQATGLPGSTDAYMYTLALRWGPDNPEPIVEPEPSDGKVLIQGLLHNKIAIGSAIISRVMQGSTEIFATVATPEGPYLATAPTLSEAQALFAELYPDTPRVDCDPNEDGSWTCSSENIDGSTPPDPGPDPEPEPEPEGPETATAPTLQGARDLFAELYPNTVRADCDPNTDGSWTCSSELIGDGGGTNPEDPTPNPPPEDDPEPENPNPDPTPTYALIAGSSSKKTAATSMMNKDVKGGHGSYNSTHHNRLQIFWSGSAWKQAWCYYASGGPGGQGDTVVVVRNFPDGNWGTPKSVHSAVHQNVHNDPNWNFGVTGGVAELDHDNHNNATMAVSANGTYVVCANMHASWMHIAHSNSANLFGSWTNVPYNRFPGDPRYPKISMARATYPCLFVYKGKVWLSTRGQTSGGGKNNAPWYWTLHEFNDSNKTWAWRSTIEYAAGARAYMTNVSTVSLPGGGERMGITGFFRNEVQGGSAAHYDLNHFYSDDGRNWRQHNLNNGGSQAVNCPVTFYIAENGGNNRGNAPVKIWDTVGRGDPQQSGFSTSYNTVDGTPLIYCRSRSDGYFFFEHGSSGWEWQRNIGIDDMTRFVTQSNGVVWAVWNAGSQIKAMNLDTLSSKVLVTGIPNNGYNLIIDEEAKKYGWLSMVVFKGGQSSPNPAYSVDIKIDDIAAFNTPFS